MPQLSKTASRTVARHFESLFALHVVVVVENPRRKTISQVRKVRSREQPGARITWIEGAISDSCAHPCDVQTNHSKDCCKGDVYFEFLIKICERGTSMSSNPYPTHGPTLALDSMCHTLTHCIWVMVIPPLEVLLLATVQSL